MYMKLHIIYPNSIETANPKFTILSNKSLWFEFSTPKSLKSPNSPKKSACGFLSQPVGFSSVFFYFSIENDMCLIDPIFFNRKWYFFDRYISFTRGLAKIGGARSAPPILLMRAGCKWNISVKEISFSIEQKLDRSNTYHFFWFGVFINMLNIGNKHIWSREDVI